MSRLKSIGEDLQQEWVKLKNSWRETREVWQDSVARNFEKKMWEEWEREVPRTIRCLQKLDQIIDEAEIKTGD